MSVPARATLPPDAAEWVGLDLDLPRLSPDYPGSCPEGEASLLEYLRVESADLSATDPNRLRFLRTAKIGRTSYWLWRYREGSGAEVYVHVTKTRDRRLLGLADTRDLTPAAFLLALHHGEVYW